MVVKHPMMFHEANSVAINKVDLADAMGVDPSNLKGDISRLNPKATVVSTDCRHMVGIREVIRSLGLA
jgi:hydrogenase nickel incorporation protein HypB